MNKTPHINITDSEWEVMRVLWSLKTTTSSEIIKVLEDKMQWKPTTIKTLTARLVKKGLVATEKQGNRYLYSPLVSETDSWRNATNNLFNHICARKMGKRIVALIEENPLSFEDLSLIQTALNLKHASAVTEIACNCIPGQCNCNDHCCP